MTEPLVAPLSAYQNRAANHPKPADHDARVLQALWEFNEHDRDLADFLAAQAACYFADASEFQPPFNSSYPYQIAWWRAHSGYRLDNHAKVNWGFHEAQIVNGRTKVAGIYLVFVPGQLPVVKRDIINAFGSKCPTARLIPEIDMESGAGFAGPGNHSPEANVWLDWLSDWTGTPYPDYERDQGYANQYDWSDNWPQRPAKMKRRVAAYTSNVIAGYFAQQYYGGDPQYASPPGAPRTCAPFGTYVDLNVIYATIATIELAYGIVVPAPPKPADPEEFMFATSIGYQVSMADAPAGTPQVGTWAYWPATNLYEHIIGSAGGVSNVAPMVGAQVGGVGPFPLTYAQHMQKVANSVNATPAAKAAALAHLATLPDEDDEEQA